VDKENIIYIYIYIYICHGILQTHKENEIMSLQGNGWNWRSSIKQIKPGSEGQMSHISPHVEAGLEKVKVYTAIYTI
jgi:hypothetical protein